MNIGFYAGSFDPFTNGHLHVVQKASMLFDKVIVGIGVNPEKTRRFDTDLMKKVIENVLISNALDNVIVITYSNLSVDAAIFHNANFLVRGIRNGMDYQYEENLASINEECAGIDTVYIRAGKFGVISSSMVMELLKNHKDVSKYLPTEVLSLVQS